MNRACLCLQFGHKISDELLLLLYSNIHNVCNKIWHLVHFTYILEDEDEDEDEDEVTNSEHNAQLRWSCIGCGTGISIGIE